MKKYANRFWLLSLVVVLGCTACIKENPNVNESGKDELKSLELETPIDQTDMEYAATFYVPIYSDIYIDVNAQNTLLAATLSIRNTSYTDSLFISKIDYFNTAGDLVRNYLTKPISLRPMGTVNYVIEKEDDTGGSGANFIVTLSARSTDAKPLIQAVMVGEYGNKGFAFSTDAYLIAN